MRLYAIDVSFAKLTDKAERDYLNISSDLVAVCRTRLSIGCAPLVVDSARMARISAALDQCPPAEKSFVGVALR